MAIYEYAEECDLMHKNNPQDTFLLCLHVCLYVRFFNLLTLMQWIQTCAVLYYYQTNKIIITTYYYYNYN